MSKKWMIVKWRTATPRHSNHSSRRPAKFDDFLHPTRQPQASGPDTASIPLEFCDSLLAKTRCIDDNTYTFLEVAMMTKKASVYLAEARVSKIRGLFQRLPDLIDAAGLDFIKKDRLVAIKCHFGEGGCTTYLNPVFVRVVVDKVLKLGALPFLTDTSTLYRSERRDGVRHMMQAYRNGFSYSTVNAPLIIADGLKSENVEKVSLNGRGKHFQEVEVAAAMRKADALIVISHFKGHLATGFGGAIKNLSMGLASRTYKQRMHASVTPEFTDRERCIGCGACMEVCPEDAITIVDGKALIDKEKCVGCAECITHCETGALKILWNESPSVLQEKMAEVASGAMQGFQDRSLFLNFALNVTPDCDCFPCSDVPIVPDVGALASRDPVAIDQATVDQVNGMPGIQGTELKSGFKKGEDKFLGMRPTISWEPQLNHAEKMGLGVRAYSLQIVP